MPKLALTPIVLAAGLALAAPASAQDLPRWNLDQACAGETAVAFCRALEARTYSDLSGVWITLQPDIREACLKDVASFGQNSYRLLDLCLEERLTALRVDFVRQARRIDDPDPPPQVEAMPAPPVEEPAPEPETLVAQPEPPAAAEPQPVMVQPEPPAPAAEPPTMAPAPAVEQPAPPASEPPPAQQ